MTSIAGRVGQHIRIYGEGGLLMILPSDEFSTESIHFGGYGLFGFEFFFYHHDNYFIEIGGVGTGAKADGIAGMPIYSNGMMIHVGYRHQL